MKGGIVRFAVDQRDIEFLVERGIDPVEFAKKAFREELARHGPIDGPQD